MKLTADQQEIVDTTDPVLVVLGGAGTGKTTTAAALVRKTIEEARAAGRSERALFLSFSKSAVSQILDRSSNVLGPFADRVEITTFHAFAWKVIARWGTAIGITDPQLFSPSEKKVFGTRGGLEYNDLIPAALKITGVPVIAAHVARRWSVIVIDEFQDTSDEHWQLILALRGNARLVLLGDLNQCIYKNLPNNPGVGPSRVKVANALPDARQILLPDVSHRDPTYILPAAANAIRLRQFNDEAVHTALSHGMLEVLKELNPAREANAVIDIVTRLRNDGHSVGIFSHHIDSTAVLSDRLNDAGVSHDIVGLPDAVDAALRAQYAMLRYACREAEPIEVLRALAIFVASSERGKEAPPLARMIARLQTRPESLDRRLRDLSTALSSVTTLRDAFKLTSGAFASVGLIRGEATWATAGKLLENMLGPRALRAQQLPPNGITHLQESIDSQHLSLLTSNDTSHPAPVQLMGLYQSKGREVDASIVILRAGDYFGREAEPMPDNSKLLYVLLTRARKKTVILAVGQGLPALVAPLGALRLPTAS